MRVRWGTRIFSAISTPFALLEGTERRPFPYGRGSDRSTLRAI